jgi:hypothetical protein
MEKIKRKGDVVKVIADSSYRSEIIDKTVCKITDTGNGYIVKFPSFSSCAQEHYVCLDYSQADLLFKGLKGFYE